MRVVAIACLLLLALPAQATVLETVPGADPAVGERIKALPQARMAFWDVNGNSRIDTDPAEPVYFDLNGNDVLEHGELRMTAYFDHPAGSAVQMGDPDAAAQLSILGGWFARTLQGAWYHDTDNNARIGIGDVILTGPDAGTLVSPSTPGIGGSLERIQQQVDSARRVGWTDPDGDMTVDVGEAVYLDLQVDPNVPQAINQGDARLLSTAFTPDALDEDDVATISRTQSQQVLTEAGFYEQDEGTPGVPEHKHAEASETEWGVILGVVNLVGLVVVVLLVLRRRPPHLPGAEE